MHENPVFSDISPHIDSWYVEEQIKDVVFLLQQEILVFILKQSGCTRNNIKYMNKTGKDFFPHILIRTLRDVGK
jgi:hypothetical protein